MENGALEIREREEQNPLKILVVDNDEGIGSLAKDIFEDQGHKVTSFTSKEEALNTLREQKQGVTFDLIITNRGYAARDNGEMDGFEFARVIKEEQLGDPYIVMLSRSAEQTMEENPEKLKEWGIDKVIKKVGRKEEPSMRQQLQDLAKTVIKMRIQSDYPHRT